MCVAARGVCYYVCINGPAVVVQNPNLFKNVRPVNFLLLNGIAIWFTRLYTPDTHTVEVELVGS